MKAYDNNTGRQAAERRRRLSPSHVTSGPQIPRRRSDGLPLIIVDLRAAAAKSTHAVRLSPALSSPAGLSSLAALTAQRRCASCRGPVLVCLRCWCRSKQGHGWRRGWQHGWRRGATGERRAAGATSALRSLWRRAGRVGAASWRISAVPIGAWQAGPWRQADRRR